MSLTRQGHQTGTAYSSIGRTRDLYSIEKTLVSAVPARRAFNGTLDFVRFVHSNTNAIIP